MSDPSSECVIIGSGRSLLDLTGAEKDYLNRHPHTLALNKYLLYHDKVGVVPKFMFLADRHYPAHRVIVDSVEIARRLPTRPRFYLNVYYKWFFRFKPRIRSVRWALQQRQTIYQERQDWIPLFLSYWKLSFFHSEPERNDRPFFWASRLKEELFFFRGSLTTAINLAHVIFPGKTIKLLGVDLDSEKSFFAEEAARVPKYYDDTNDPVAQKAGQHLTAIPLCGFKPIQSIIPRIMEHLASVGVQLVCSNPTSLLCQEGICPYRPVIDS